MNKTIVTLSNKEIKSFARRMLKSYYLKLVFTIIACNIIVAAPEYIAERMTDNVAVLNIVSLLTTILNLYFNISILSFILAIFRSEKFDINDFFGKGDLLLKAIIIKIVVSIKIVLWSMLFIIPGIICSIRYSQAFFILVDHPLYSPSQCMRASKDLMDGNKGKYFSLLLSFLGLLLLAALPASIHQFIYGPSAPDLTISVSLSSEALLDALNSYLDAMSEYQEGIVPMLLSLIPVFVYAYMNMAYACFYDLACGQLVLTKDGKTVESDETDAKECLTDAVECTEPASDDKEE